MGTRSRKQGGRVYFTHKYDRKKNGHVPLPGLNIPWLVSHQTETSDGMGYWQASHPAPRGQSSATHSIAYPEYYTWPACWMPPVVSANAPKLALSLLRVRIHPAQHLHTNTLTPTLRLVVNGDVALTLRSKSPAVEHRIWHCCVTGWLLLNYVAWFYPR